MIWMECRYTAFMSSVGDGDETSAFDCLLLISWASTYREINIAIKWRHVFRTNDKHTYTTAVTRSSAHMCYVSVGIRARVCVHVSFANRMSRCYFWVFINGRLELSVSDIHCLYISVIIGSINNNGDSNNSNKNKNRSNNNYSGLDHIFVSCIQPNSPFVCK